MASIPLGSVRGIEGLTNWEYMAFQEACSNRYRSGDEEREEAEDDMFEWYQQLSEYCEQYPDDSDDEDYYYDEESPNYNNTSSCWDDDNGGYWVNDDDEYKAALEQRHSSQDTSASSTTAASEKNSTSSSAPPFVYKPPRRTPSSKDPFANIVLPKPIRWAPGPAREPNLVPVSSLINSSNQQGTQEPR